MDKPFVHIPSAPSGNETVDALQDSVAPLPIPVVEPQPETVREQQPDQPESVLGNGQHLEPPKEVIFEQTSRTAARDARIDRDRTASSQRSATSSKGSSQSQQRSHNREPESDSETSSLQDPTTVVCRYA